ncbi:hypothetical protein LTR64_001972 [Lithohypha guttulata]|uniref:uncharacterized protein n=1 Tax=Lithohypha guttulata TaxID=1690604 RepID=UPI002DE04EF4|nr:hypothetical protein LTR51_007831 [Lithohypha guttulata]
MGMKTVVGSFALFAAAASAQSPSVATYSNEGHSIAVNVPSDTASSGSGPIFFQISAPSGTAWTAFGQGSRMAGSNMFVIYSAGNGNVTLSPRLGTGHNMPQHDSSTMVTLLEGSGVASDGSLIANVRCDNCNSWSGGSMSYTSSSSSWIYASRSGSALDSTDVSESIAMHNSDTSFSLDLTEGTGGSSPNPFVAASEAPAESTSSSAGTSATASNSASATSSNRASATASSSASATSSNGVSAPVVSSGSDGSGSSSSGSSSGAQRPTNNSATLRSAHGIIMSVLFLGLFPFVSLTLYLPTAIKVRYIHAPLQILNLVLLIAGMALGIVLGQRFDALDGYHMIIGYIVVICLILFQPAMGLYQHLYYHRTGGSSFFGVAHRWFGRTMILLGIVNGGLGWYIAGNTSAYVPYAIVAAIVVLIYISVLLFAWYKSGKKQDPLNEKAGSDRSYEMQRSRESRHQRLSSNEYPQNGTQSTYHQQQRQNTRYTIGSR